MEMSFFQQSVVELMKQLSEKYSFVIRFDKSGLVFRSFDFDIYFYLENYFQISVGFRFGNFLEKTVPVKNLAKYLGEEYCVLDKNQLGSLELNSYLCNIIPILDKIIFRVKNEPKLLLECHSLYVEHTYELLDEYNISLLRKNLYELWQKKDYELFYDEYIVACKYYPIVFKNDKLLKRKSDYARNQSGENQSGDDSVTATD